MTLQLDPRFRSLGGRTQYSISTDSPEGTIQHAIHHAYLTMYMPRPTKPTISCIVHSDIVPVCAVESQELLLWQVGRVPLLSILLMSTTSPSRPQVPLVPVREPKFHSWVH